MYGIDPRAVDTPERVPVGASRRFALPLPPPDNEDAGGGREADEGRDTEIKG